MSENQNLEKSAMRQFLGLDEDEELLSIDELIEKFDVDLHIAGYVIVTRKEDKARGTMKYSDSPRFYYGFIKTSTKRTF